MQVLNRLGKLPLNRALTLIKAISKKKAKAIAAEKPNFLAGAKDNGISETEAEQLFELILKFAGYGFNKAHSTRYAIVAYQTAYFKVHHPCEFLASTLTFECGDTDKVVQYMAEAERMGIKVAPPDINTCGSDFAVDGQAVRFGLAAVKGVGAKAVEAIVRGRQEVESFSDLYHFCENVDLRSTNRATIEALIKCGAFDALGAHRAAMLAALPQAVELGQEAAANRRSGQMSFFGAGALDQDQAAPVFPDVEPLSEAQLLTAEKETLGFYITSHPLVHYGRELDGLSAPKGIALSRLEGCQQGAAITIGCMIASVRYTYTKKNNQKMAMLTVEDLTGKCDAVVFPKTFEQTADHLAEDAMVFIVGTVDWRRERPNIIVENVIPIDRALGELTAQLTLRLAADQANKEALRQTAELLKRHQGNCPIVFELSPFSRPDVRAMVRPDRQWFVQPTRKLLDELAELFAQEDMLLAGKVNGNGAAGRGKSYRNGRYQRPAVRQPAATQPASLE